MFYSTPFCCLQNQNMGCIHITNLKKNMITFKMGDCYNTSIGGSSPPEIKPKGCFSSVLKLLCIPDNSYSTTDYEYTVVLPEIKEDICVDELQYALDKSYENYNDRYSTIVHVTKN